MGTFNITPKQHADLQGYETDPERAPREWRTYQGGRWADRNPADALSTDESFRERYGITKTWAARDALRSVARDVSVLEVGCSRGAHMSLFGALGFSDVMGMDISLQALQLARTRNVCQGDALHLPFADASVDLLTTAGTIMHLGPSPRLRACLLEMARVTRRYLFLVELWSDRIMVVSFGDLLPPVWLCGWEATVPHVLGAERWLVRYHHVYNLPRRGVLAPLCFTLLERADPKTS